MVSGSAGDESISLDAVTAVLQEYPVSVGFLFGSHARGDAGEQSDIDLAVAFTDLAPGDPGYNDTLFGLSADLVATLGTDDIDVIDLRQASAALARAVFEDGTRLVGSEDEVRRLREQLLDDGGEDRSPRDRFDDLLVAIDEHLA